MTREEFIQEMADYFDENDLLLDLTTGLERVDIESIVDTVLDKMEKLGIAPPEVKGAYHDGRMLKRYWE